MNRSLLFFFLAALALAIGTQASLAQPGTFQTIPVPTDPAPLEVARGDYYDGRQVFVRLGQQGIHFTFLSNTVVQLDVRTKLVDTSTWSEWIDLHESGNGGISSYLWNSLPFTEPGAYDMELRVYGVAESRVHPLRAIVVPPAQHAYGSDETIVDPFTGQPIQLPNGDGTYRDSTLHHTILVWQGGNALDRPILVVEGIDAENINGPEAYYALGADPEAPLFPLSQSEGADIAILNWGDGGRRMQANAVVVERAVERLRDSNIASVRNLSVIGVSMGGVIARYALADMESRNRLHSVDTFVSVDAPQQGAVVQPSLQLRIRERLAPQDWPKGLARPAARQLLVYNAFDDSVPTDHDAFYAELNALNGGVGYPTRTRNVGVSFGTPSPNSRVGQRWGRLDLDILGPSGGGWNYDIGGLTSGGVPELTGLPGSYLPLDITKITGRTTATLPEPFPIGVVVAYDFVRYDPANPTFIPYASALDLVQGTSRFNATFALSATELPSFHDFVPEGLVTPMLQELGYALPPPPVTTLTITGPTQIGVGERGYWNAVLPQPSAGYQYAWDYRIRFFGGCGGGGPIIGELPLQGDPGAGGASNLDPTGGGVGTHTINCGQWHRSPITGPSFSHRENGAVWLDIRVRATNASGTSEQSPIHRVRISGGSTGGGHLAGDPPSEGADGAAKTTSAAATAALETAVVDGVWPNPVPASGGTVRFTLAEAGHATVRVFDALGREVARLADGWHEAGAHVAVLAAERLPSGSYVVRLETGAAADTRVVTVVK